MKLKSGREVELVPLTTRQRVQCNDMISKQYMGDGNVILGNLYEAKLMWAMHGLGLKSFEDFDKKENIYSDDEIIEISLAVQEADEKARNPISQG